MVECFLAKEDVAGSTPVSRSNKRLFCATLLKPLAGLSGLTSRPLKSTRGAVPKW